MSERFHPHRREFLQRAALLSIAPIVATACRRREKPASSVDNSSPSKLPRNLDEVGDLATFRPAPPTVEPIVRVRVLRVREPAKRPWIIGSAGDTLAMRLDGTAGTEQALKSPLEIEMTPRGWSVVDGRGFRAAVGPHETFEVYFVGNPDALMHVTSENGSSRMYRGMLRLVAREDFDERRPNSGEVIRHACAFDVINDVPIEAYLPGVLAGELYASWHLETFAAQAIAARSFACTEAAIFAGRRHYDLTNTAASQMYLGEVQHPRAREAVAATRGKVLAFENLLVSGYYSSCCGGIAASAPDAIGSNPVNDVPPLHGRSGSDVCTEAPVFRWSIEERTEQVTRRIAAYAEQRGLTELADLQRLHAVEVSATNAHGRPTRMAIVDQDQMRVEISAEEFRRAANFGEATGPIKPPERELRSSNLRTSVSHSNVTFEGYGFGHGVGLCQFGAQALARSGSKYEDILRWYYPNVDLLRAYG